VRLVGAWPSTSSADRRDVSSTSRSRPAAFSSHMAGDLSRPRRAQQSRARAQSSRRGRSGLHNSARHGVGVKRVRTPQSHRRELAWLARLGSRAPMPPQTQGCLGDGLREVASGGEMAALSVTILAAPGRPSATMRPSALVEAAEAAAEIRWDSPPRPASRPVARRSRRSALGPAREAVRRSSATRGSAMCVGCKYSRNWCTAEIRPDTALARERRCSVARVTTTFTVRYHDRSPLGCA
jgi:hypothetical protein